MDTPLVINIDTGVISFRTKENAEQCNCRPISRKHADMLANGEIDIKDLLAAIKKHMMSADGFNYEKYADDRRRLNVRHSALHADERVPVTDADASEYISDDEIVKAGEVGDDAVESAVDEVVSKKPRKVEAKPETKTAKTEGAFPFID